MLTLKRVKRKKSEKSEESEESENCEKSKECEERKKRKKWKWDGLDRGGGRGKWSPRARVQCHLICAGCPLFPDVGGASGSQSRTHIDKTRSSITTPEYGSTAIAAEIAVHSSGADILL